MMINKIFITQRPHPWVTWGNQLYVHDRNAVTIKPDFDAIIIDWFDGISDSDVHDKINLAEKSSPMIVVYMEDLVEFDFLLGFHKTYNSNFTVLSENEDVLTACKNFHINHNFWMKPTRVSSGYQFGFPWVSFRTMDFITICNASREEDNLPELIKTFFAMCLYEAEDGEILGSNDMEIFSAQELPVEPFNNVRFNGLQPTPIVIKALKRSSLFISPYGGPTISINIIDAIMAGTPVLIKDTKANRTLGLDEDRYYSDQKSLAKAIKWYKLYNGSELDEIAKENFIKFKQRENVSVEGSFNRLMEILNKVGR